MNTHEYFSVWSDCRNFLQALCSFHIDDKWWLLLQVSWIRARDVTVLSVGHLAFSSDARIGVVQVRYPDTLDILDILSVDILDILYLLSMGCRLLWLLMLSRKTAWHICCCKHSVINTSPPSHNENRHHHLYIWSIYWWTCEIKWILQPFKILYKIDKKHCYLSTTYNYKD